MMFGLFLKTYIYHESSLEPPFKSLSFMPFILWKWLSKALAISFEYEYHALKKYVSLYLVLCCAFLTFGFLVIPQYQFA